MFNMNSAQSGVDSGNEVDIEHVRIESFRNKPRLQDLSDEEGVETSSRDTILRDDEGDDDVNNSGESSSQAAPRAQARGDTNDEDCHDEGEDTNREGCNDVGEDANGEGCNDEGDNGPVNGEQPEWQPLCKGVVFRKLRRKGEENSTSGNSRIKREDTIRIEGERGHAEINALLWENEQGAIVPQYAVTDLYRVVKNIKNPKYNLSEEIKKHVTKEGTKGGEKGRNLITHDGVKELIPHLRGGGINGREEERLNLAKEGIDAYQSLIQKLYIADEGTQGRDDPAMDVNASTANESSMGRRKQNVAKTMQETMGQKQSEAGSSSNRNKRRAEESSSSNSADKRHKRNSSMKNNVPQSESNESEDNNDEINEMEDEHDDEPFPRRVSEGQRQGNDRGKEAAQTRGQTLDSNVNSAGAKRADSSAGAKRADSSSGAKRADSSAGAKRADHSSGAKRADSSAGAKRADSSAGAKKADSSAGAKKADSSAGENSNSEPNGAAQNQVDSNGGGPSAADSHDLGQEEADVESMHPMKELRTRRAFLEELKELCEFELEVLQLLDRTLQAKKDFMVRYPGIIPEFLRGFLQSRTSI